jgi:hypothetical protein
VLSDADEVTQWRSSITSCLSQNSITTSKSYDFRDCRCRAIQRDSGEGLLTFWPVASARHLVPLTFTVTSCDGVSFLVTGHASISRIHHNSIFAWLVRIFRRVEQRNVSWGSFNVLL